MPTREVSSALDDLDQPCFLLEQLMQLVFTCNRLARLITLTGEGELEEIKIQAYGKKDGDTLIILDEIKYLSQK